LGALTVGGVIVEAVPPQPKGKIDQHSVRGVCVAEGKRGKNPRLIFTSEKH